MTVDCPVTLPPVYCDANAIRQVFWNLLLNAVESIEGQGNIVIRVRHEPSFCSIKVIDDGAGIPQEDVGRIFEPFHTTKGRGTGLGLAIVKRIIQDHGWKISVESREGKGTEFTIIITNEAGQHPPCAYSLSTITRTPG
jgi:signal transduction histidine kinase